MQIHGGDIYRNEVELDFSANINPFGMPDRVAKAAMKGVQDSIHYPDVMCTRLKDAIAVKEDVSRDWVVCGNGAAEVIFQLVAALRPKRGLILAPTFAEYELALKSVGCEIICVELKPEEHFMVEEDILNIVDESYDLMFLCNPNNPTGQVIAPSLLTRIFSRCRECGVFLVIDECFQDFLSEEDADSRVQSLNEYSDVLILKAFTKMYGMAGLRLGYGLTSNQSLTKHMKEVTQPWNISTPAQYAGVAACEEIGYEEKTRVYIKEQRQRLSNGLKQQGLQVFDSKANYIFFRGRRGLYEECLRHKILIRSCANYHGLDDTYYRVAVKSASENEILLQVLQQIRKETGELSWQR